MIGKILYTSWGYNMTLVDYCKIIEETEKSVRCVMIDKTIENDNGGGSGRCYPIIDEVISKPFLLRKKDNCFKGSYPFSGESKRMDYFNEYDGKGNYYNTWD